ncbi:hypothetical protein RFI_25052, partial [Reticulomyxa filosa]
HVLSSTNGQSNIDVKDTTASPLLFSFHNRPSHVLIANTTLYTILRLYFFLFDRLRTAKKLSWKPHSIRKLSDAEKFEINQQFYNLVWNMLDDEINEQKFENKLFLLLGTQAYELTTLKMLISTLTKEFITHISADFSHIVQFVNLWKYYTMQWKLIDPNDWKARLDLMHRYHNDMRARCPDHHKLPLVQIEYFLDTDELAMQVICANHIATDVA